MSDINSIKISNSMKRIINIFIFGILSLLTVGCYDRSVIDDKGLDFYIPPVSNAQYSIDGTTLTLTWSVPSDISDEYVRPIYVQIQEVENNIYTEKVTVAETVTSATFTIDTANEYHYIIKTNGTFTDEAQLNGRTPSVTSEGVIVYVK